MRLMVPVLIIVLGMVLFSFLSGGIGVALLGEGKVPGFLVVEKPHPKLPAETVSYLGSIPITNTMIASWLTIILLSSFAIAATRKMKLVPTGMQNILEAVFEGMLNFSEEVAGKEKGRKFFPVIFVIFLYVLANAWLGLLPGFGTILIHTHEGEAELLRGANTDINLTLALAVVSFVFVEYWGVVTQGPFGYASKFFNVSKLTTSVKNIIQGKLKEGFNQVFSGVIDVFVGLLEGVSELIRLVSFSFRLFGNMTAGEILLLIAVFLVPWIVPVAFYGLELLVGFIQALIFSGLTLVFATLATQSAHDAH